VPVSSSPIRGVSLTTVVTQGAAWTISGADMLFHNPLQGLGLLALSEIGMTVAAVTRAARETLAVAVKYRLRERLGIPPDWVPPEDP
jgi:energy-converting hydrogenase Eha subunit C